MDTKKCYKCKIEKPISNFYKNKVDKSGHDSYCKICRISYHKSRKSQINKIRREKMKTDIDYRKKVLKDKRKSHRNNLEKALFNRAKRRAIKHSLDFTISINNIIIPKKCPILEIDIIPGIKGNYLATPSLDRIDNTKGYTKENVQVISMLANSMKNAASKELLIRFSKNINKYINED